MRHCISTAGTAAALTLFTLVTLAFAPSACGNSDSGGPAGNGAGGAVTGLGGASGTGTAGAGMGAGGAMIFAAGGSAGAAACRQTGESCGPGSECCNEAVCNQNAAAPELRGCHPKCNVGADCATGCCFPFEGKTNGYCLDAKWCSCGADGARCGTTLPRCCDTQFCVGGDAAASFYECRKRCTASTDCTTNCCVAIAGTGVSACLDPMYCPK